MTSRPLSVCTARKSNVPIQSIMDLHFPESRCFYDPTWGKGVFWQDFDRDPVFILASDIAPDRLPEHGFVADCRATGIADKSVDVVVIDLPFMHAKNQDVGTRLFADYTGIKSQKEFVSTTVEAAVEARRVARHGFVLKCKDAVESGKLKLSHVDIINGVDQEIGKRPHDVLVFVPAVTLANDPKWGPPQHFRRQESYFLIYKL